MNFENDLKRLLDKLRGVPMHEHRGEIDRCIQDAHDLASHNESGVALENLCENLYEWEFPLTEEIFSDIQRLANQLGLKQHYVDIVKKLLA